MLRDLIVIAAIYLCGVDLGAKAERAACDAELSDAADMVRASADALHYAGDGLETAEGAALVLWCREVPTDKQCRRLSFWARRGGQ